MSDLDEAPQKPGVIRSLYDWMMRNASGRHAWTALAGLTFAEASFFPIPTDIMLIPMVLADRKRAFVLAGWCTLWSVIGGALGYAIGAYLYQSLGQWLIQLYHLGSDMQTFQAWYGRYGAWVILIKGFTPIPYKLVTITSGLAAFSFPMFVAASAVTRGARFFLAAALIKRFGPQVEHMLEKRLYTVTGIALAVLVAGFLIVRALH